MKCDGCSAPCCKKFIKFITIYDAYRIIKGLKIEPMHFMDLRSSLGINSAMPTVQIHNKPYLLALDGKSGSEECTFIMQIGNSRKCGIHQLRPLGCRAYPYVLQQDEFTLGLTDEFLCPRQWFPEGEEKTEYLSVLRRQKKEQEDYRVIVDAWNTEHGDAGSLYQFVEYALDKVQP